MDQTPFDANSELCNKLYLTADQRISRRSQQTQPAVQKAYLPGDPRINLDDLDVGRYLETEFIAKDLDKLARHLWLVAKQDSSHISSLTHQIVRGRDIVITEKPELHLVWIYDRVFIKPLPRYLLSYAFWQFYLVSQDSPIPEPQRQSTMKACRGFLRSYAYLIQHKSDFNIATREEGPLLPKNISYADFINFIKFLDIKDETVSPRYKFGELRLTRLNFWAKVFLFRFNYHKVEGQYGAHFARFYAPILFIIGVFSVLLSAMQVALAVQPQAESNGSWTTFAIVSRGFSVFTIVVVVAISLFLLLTFISMSFREIVYAMKDRHRQKWEPKACRKRGNGTGV